MFVCKICDWSAKKPRFGESEHNMSPKRISLPKGKYQALIGSDTLDIDKFLRITKPSDLKLILNLLYNEKYHVHPMRFRVKEHYEKNGEFREKVKRLLKDHLKQSK